MGMHKRSVWVCSTLLFCGSSRLLGQGETTSAIVGSVVDATGASVGAATVTVVSNETGSRRSVITDDTGRFNFPQLKPGPYAVKVEAVGFEPQTNPSVS